MASINPSAEYRTANTTLDTVKPNCALISVSDKLGIIEFARALAAYGIQILSTGGTASQLSANGIQVTSVSEYTGFPELMGGRLKTLHPKIHGGILGRPDVDSAEMQANQINAINLVVVNLYPFEQVSAEPSTTTEIAIENIDIGGPAMIRAAAKNMAHTTVVVDPADYHEILKELEKYGGIRAETRCRLARKAYRRTANYDAAIANYLAAQDHADEAWPTTLNFTFEKKLDMRYGENPHQSAAFYLGSSVVDSWFQQAVMHQGKSLSFNNVADVDAAYNCIAEFSEPACVIIKHATPCGAAVAEDITRAYALAYQTDPTSAFGGIIAVNATLDAATAELILCNQFVEVILAPGVSPAALGILKDKQNIRVLEHPAQSDDGSSLRLSSACGGLLVQSSDTALLAGEEPQVVTQRHPDHDEYRDLLFAWTVAKHVKSNAIVYVKGQATIGIGAGQMSRVDSAKIAALKAADANLQIEGAVMASDAFFPFRDGIDTAAHAGIRAVIQPGGSLRDDDVVAAADEHGIAMLFTGMRHFRH